MQNNQNIEKITLKFVQMKFLAMDITNQNLSFDIFAVGNVQTQFQKSWDTVQIVNKNRMQ